MIIFGWGNRKSVIGSGEFDCPICKVSTAYNQVRTRRWFSLFFVPIFPVSHSDDAIECRQCRTSIRTEALGNALNLAQPSGGISQFAIVGMLLGVISLLMSCLFFVATPMSLFAVILSHSGLRAIKKSQPPLDGNWQAITGLVTGYMALCLSIAIGTLVIMAPRWFPRDRGNSTGSVFAQDQDSQDGEFRVSDLSNEALKAAEYEIAAKRDKPSGRGNSPEAVALAQEYSEKIKELSDLLFTSGKKSIIQLSDGEYLTYCELNHDSCIFLVHVPSYRKFTDDAKKALAELAWATAQVTTAGKLESGARLGVGLRGVLRYGDILVGTSVESSESNITPYQAGTKEELVQFFQRSDTLQVIQHSSNSSVDQDPFSANNSNQANSQTSSFESDFFGDQQSLQTAPKSDTNIVSSDISARDSERVSIAGTPGTTVSGTFEDSRSAKKSRIRSASEELPFENKIPVRNLKIVENNSWGFTSLAFSPNGKWLAGGKMDQSLVIVNTSTWEVTHHEKMIQDIGQISSVAFDSTSQRIVAGGGSGQTKVWGINDSGQLAEPKNLFRFESEVQLLEVSQKHPFFLGASSKGTIAWQAFGDSKSQPRTLSEFKKDIRAVWIPSNGIEAQATDGAKLIRFSLRDGQIVQSVELATRNPKFAAFSSDGNLIAVVNSDTLVMIDRATEGNTRSVNLPKRESPYSIQIDPLGKFVLIGMRTKVAIYDSVSLDLLAYAPTQSRQAQSNLTFSLDGNVFAASASTAQDSIYIFEIGDQSQLTKSNP